MSGRNRALSRGHGLGRPWLPGARVPSLGALVEIASVPGAESGDASLATGAGVFPGAGEGDKTRGRPRRAGAGGCPSCEVG